MTDNDARGGVIVCGIDGSSGARRALQEAIRTAARRGDRVRAVAVYEPPEMWAAWGYGAASGVALPDPDALHGDELTLPEIEVETRAGRPAEVLVELAGDADGLVVGHRGRGAFGSVVLGSVGLGCVLRASCPVTVVPDPVAA